MTHTYGIQPVNEESIALAVSLIEQGEVVVIPTDTVYGVVAHPVHAQAVEKIFTVKHRPHEKSVQILAASLTDTQRYGVRVPQALNPVVSTFMPGAVSIIATVNRSESLETLATVREEAASGTFAE